MDLVKIAQLGEVKSRTPIMDLRFLDWSISDGASYTGGQFLKCVHGDKYYKLSSCDILDGIVYGHESVNEVLIGNLLGYWNIPHIPYYLEHCITSLGIHEVETDVCYSMDFSKSYPNLLSLEAYCQLIGSKDILMLDKLFDGHIKEMLMVDYIIGNLDRHGANVLLSSINGLVKMVPLFDHGCSLMSWVQDKFEDVPVSRYVKDVPVNNYLGSKSLEQNLRDYLDYDCLPKSFPMLVELLCNGLTLTSLVQKDYDMLKARYTHAKEIFA